MIVTPYFAKLTGIEFGKICLSPPSRCKGVHALFLRGEIGVTQHFLNRLKRTKKLNFIEEKFNKIRPDPNLRVNLLKLAPLLHLFIKVVIKKNGSK